MQISNNKVSTCWDRIISWSIASSLLLLQVVIFNACEASGEKQERRWFSRNDSKSTSDTKDAEYGEFRYQGNDRTYLLYTPDSYKGDKAAALVVVLHGGHGDAKVALERTGFNEIADREGFLVLYPEGIGKYWNDGRSTVPGKADDVGFITTLIDHVAKQKNIDSRRVYVTGSSNGGLMTQRLACEAPDRFAAFAAVIANFPVELEPVCKSKHHASMMIINGKDDVLMPWAGGEIKKGRFVKGGGGAILSAEETAQFWAKKNQCDNKYDHIKLPDKDPSDDTRIEKFKYLGCKNGTEVILYAVDGGGHTWPGSKTRTLRISGKVSQDMNASEVIWEFFDRHRGQ